MSLKVPILCNFIFSIISVVVLTACFPLEQSYKGQEVGHDTFKNAFTIPQQKAPPGNIQSIRLHPIGSPDNPPIIELGGRERLVLSFDYLDEQTKQFRLELSHRTANWEESSLNPSQFLKGFDYAYIQTGQQSFTSRPTYQHMKYEFPNNDLQPAVSGNYLLEVYDDNSGGLLFSYPFFVTEDEGTLNTKIEQLFAQRRDGRPLDQPFSNYRYPPFVEFPQFDLSFYYAQNQFWGRTRQTQNFDTSTPGSVSFHLTRNDAFVAGHDFKILDLRSLNSNGRRILEYRPGTTPPQIILQRDVLYLDANPQLFPETGIGSSRDDRRSEYADVHFSLEIPDEMNPDSAGAGIYIVGDFNNWMISPQNKMNVNPNSELWEGRALIKQGQYAYKYVKVVNGGIDDFALDNSFISTSREYTTFVYFKDPNLQFDRLLKVDHVTTTH